MAKHSVYDSPDWEKIRADRFRRWITQDQDAWRVLKANLPADAEFRKDQDCYYDNCGSCGGTGVFFSVSNGVIVLKDWEDGYAPCECKLFYKREVKTWR